MCIRDRDRKHFDVAAANRAQLEEMGLAPVNIDRVDSCTRSVSYTHLRAHETVLDLVCRLLLEKKKNPRQYHNSCYKHTQEQLDSRTSCVQILVNVTDISSI